MWILCWLSREWWGGGCKHFWRETREVRPLYGGGKTMSGGGVVRSGRTGGGSEIGMMSELMSQVWNASIWRV